MGNFYPMWVCDKCKLSQYHPMIYCPRCPGRLRCEKKEIPHPANFKTQQDLENHVKSQGLDYEGEYASFDQNGKLVRKGL